ncbi:MAG: phosphate ABC transporter permease PstA [Pseudomonadales bacterium]|nr:phosphate ABC transporter permease PstA [Pseudomonadales bacterium]
MATRETSGLRSWLRSGEPWVWMNAAAVGTSILAVIGLVGLIAWNGLAHFWPHAIVQLETGTADNPVILLGELVDTDTTERLQYEEATGDGALPEAQTTVTRVLLKTGNRRTAPPDFRWVYDHRINRISQPVDAIVIERTEWGNAYGFLESVRDGDRTVTGVKAQEALARAIDFAEELRENIRDLQQAELQRVNAGIEALRLEDRRIALSDRSPTDKQSAHADVAQRRAALEVTYATLERELREHINRFQGHEITLRRADGETEVIPLANIVRTWQPNAMSLAGKLGHYLSSVWLFLSEDPREANTEGGIFPALFGTVMMVLLMSLLVTPFGVIAAIYLREYAHQGAFVRLIRIAVNNLAGVPSIVYGVFGLGFFVYFVGAGIDQLLFPEALPAPTFGTPGLLWASLTLALLTVPVVVVSTEEGLTRIPRSVREGSLALGATKAETLFRVILPMASPAILTGVILAVARAAGEVAPLMLVGVVKLAPTLPVDGLFPFLHLDRKFMHLGFHIYDVGFQSPNVEAARPLVYATTLLLLTIILLLNLTAILLRNRLEQRYRGVEG